MLVPLLSVHTGCFSTRSERPLTSALPSLSLIAILPVLKSQVRITVEGGSSAAAHEAAVADSPRDSYEYMARLANEILDDLARGHDRLLGPSRTQGALSASARQRLKVYLEDPGPLDEGWKTRGLAETVQELSTDRVVRVRVQLLLKQDAHDEMGNPIGGSWGGTTKVTAQLLCLSPPALIAQGDGEDRIWGTAGVLVEGGYGAGLIVPYAFGRGLGKSLDTSMREALTALRIAMEKEG